MAKSIETLTQRGRGRTKGSKNKSTIVREQLLSCADIQEKILSGELKSPLAFMIEVYSNQDEDIKTRLAAAKEVAAYLHRKMPVETNTNITTNSTDQLFQIQLVSTSKPTQE